MSRQLPNPGTYNARRTAAIVVREEESGSLMAYIPYALVGSDVAFSGNHSQCLGAKDGTIQTKSIATLRKIFPSWDGLDPFGLEEIPLPENDEAEFELGDCFHDEYTPKETDENPNPEAITTFKVQWLNPLGGGLPSKVPMTPEERKKALTKWGGKFKAVSGGAPAKPAAKTSTPSAPPARGKVPTPPSRKTTTARKSSQEEVWTAYAKANKDGDQDALAKAYYDAQDEVQPGANGELTPEQWGQVAEKLGV